MKELIVLSQEEVEIIRKEVKKHTHIFCDEQHLHSYKCLAVNKEGDEIWLLVAKILCAYSVFVLILRDTKKYCDKFFRYFV